MDEKMHGEGEAVLESHITEADLPDALNIVERYDQSRANLVQACANFGLSQTIENTQEISACELLLSKALKESVVSIINTEPDELNRASQIANLAIGEHKELFDFFKRETGCQHPDQVGEQMLSLATEVQAAMSGIDDPEVAAESFIDHITDIHQADISHFIEHVYANAEESEPSRPKRIAHRLGRMAIGASTIAVGVAGGITIAKLFN